MTSDNPLSQLEDRQLSKLIPNYLWSSFQSPNDKILAMWIDVLMSNMVETTWLPVIDVYY